MKSIEVYYSPRQVSNPDSSSPSPRKPALVVKDWIARDLPICIMEPVPVTREQVALLRMFRTPFPQQLEQTPGKNGT